MSASATAYSYQSLPYSSQPDVASAGADPASSSTRGFELPSVIGAEVARALSDLIIFLDLEPGSRLTEEELCTRFGVSRSPVREALKTLESDGLILRSARRGVRVAPVSRQDLDGVYACRAVLEGLAAAEAARHACAASRAELQSHLDALDAATADRDVSAFFASNVALTRTIHQNSGNPTLMRVVGGIEKQALRYRYLAHSRTQEMMDLALAGHKDVCQAIFARNPDLAQRRATRMIRRAHAVVARALAKAYPTEAPLRPADIASSAQKAV